MLFWSTSSLTTRTAAQCLPIVIRIDVDYNQYCSRLTGRRTCLASGHIYNVYFQPPRVAELCDVDGSKLVTRNDDREEVIRERLTAYELQTRPVAEYYEHKGRLVSVNGDLPVDEVTGQIFRDRCHGPTSIGMAIVCKSAAEIEKMRRSGRIVREVLDHVRALVAPGATTMDLERAAEKKIKELGAKPAFKGYYDYPCVLCTSVNEEIVHGIPSEKRVLKAGDIVSIDCGVVLDGYYGDAAITVPVDDSVKPEVRKLLEVTEASLYKGIEQARVGNAVGDVGAAVQEYVEANGFSVVREFVGHGIGTRLHEEPQVPNFGARGHGARLARRHGARDRADGEFRQAGNPRAGRQVDRGHRRRQLQRPLRALRGGDQRRPGDFDAVRSYQPSALRLRAKCRSQS